MYNESLFDDLPAGKSGKTYDVSIRVSGKPIEGAPVAVEFEGEGSLAPDRETWAIEGLTNADGLLRFTWYRWPADEDGDFSGGFRAWCAVEQCIVEFMPAAE
jgi:hypothetical protein